jgi:hypothetical protein
MKVVILEKAVKFGISAILCPIAPLEKIAI